MNWEQHDCRQLEGKMKEQWGKLSEDDFDVAVSRPT